MKNQNNPCPRKLKINNNIKLKTMYTQNKIQKTNLKVNTSYEGETIEQKMRRVTQNKEPITDGAPIIYTERKDGVQPDYNIRTDKWDIAIEAKDQISKTNIAKRQMGIGDRAFENMTIEQKSEHIKKFPESKHKDWTPPATE